MAGKLSIGAAWAEAAAFLRAERRVLAPVVLGLIMVPAVVAEMIQPRVTPGSVPEGGTWVIVALLMVGIMLLGQLVIVVLANRWNGSVGEAIARAARRLPTLLVAGILVIAPLFILLSLALALGGVSGGAALGGKPSPAGALALSLLLVAALFVMIRLLPLVAVVAATDDGPVAALKRTFVMTRGNFWRLLGFALLLTLAFAIVAIAFAAVVGSLVTLALGRPEPWSVSLLMLALIGGLVQAGFVTLYTAMLARIADQLLGDSTSEAPTSGT